MSYASVAANATSKIRMKLTVIVGLVLLALVSPIQARSVENTSSNTLHPKDLFVKRSTARRDVVISSAKIHQQIQSIVPAIGNITEVDVCKACIPLVNLVRELIANNHTLEEILVIGFDLCIALPVLTRDLCRGVMDNLAPEVVYVVNHTDHTATHFCAYYAGGINDCIDDTYYEAFDWTIDIPGPIPAYNPPALPSESAPKLRVLQISDIHPDPQYFEGSLVECNEPLCCREKFGPPTEENQTAAGKFGGNGQLCDIPWSFVEDTFRHLSENEQFDFILWTGDIPPHDVWEQTKENNVNMLEQMMDLFREYFPDTPIYPNLGNHETEPVNSYPIPSIYGDYPVSYLYSQLNESWRGLFDDFNPDTVLTGGYYSANVSPRLKIISINSNYGNAQDWFLIIDGEDPTSEQKWIVEQFLDAEANGQKVLLIGHIPPGSGGIAFPWGKNFNNITNRFKNVLAGQFYGHTHDDQFQIVYDETDPSNRIPINVVYVAPSLTTYGYVNPAYRVYTVDGDYDGSSFAILDHETYYIDLVESNSQGTAIWRKLYSAKEEYGLSSLQPSEWQNLVERMATNETLFQSYYRNEHRNAHGRNPCDEDCKESILCGTKTSWTGAELLC